MTLIKFSPKLANTISTVVIASKNSKFDNLGLSPAEIKYIEQ